MRLEPSLTAEPAPKPISGTGRDPKLALRSHTGVAGRLLIAVIEGFYFTAMGPITYHARRSLRENAG